MRGITVILHNRVMTGRDGFNNPIYTDVVTPVDNVLVGEPTTDEVVNTLTVEGKHLAYTLAIPKGDTNHWKNATVEFFGETFRTIGEPTQGIEALIPLSWNKKVKVERYE